MPIKKVKVTLLVSRSWRGSSYLEPGGKKVMSPPLLRIKIMCIFCVVSL